MATVTLAAACSTSSTMLPPSSSPPPSSPPPLPPPLAGLLADTIQKFKKKLKNRVFRNTNAAKVTAATARVAAEHASFNRICQVAPICTPFNTQFLGLTLN